MTTSIVINVGGSLYETLPSTLASRGGVLAVMFGSDSTVQQYGTERYARDANSRPFIDRDGPSFACVMSYLRTGIALVPDGVGLSVVQVQQELEYYFPGPDCPLAMPPIMAAAMRDPLYAALEAKRETVETERKKKERAVDFDYAAKLRREPDAVVSIEIGCTRCPCQKQELVRALQEKYHEHWTEIKRLLERTFGGTVTEESQGSMTLSFPYTAQRMFLKRRRSEPLP